jgi:hypothetical protein
MRAALLASSEHSSTPVTQRPAVTAANNWLKQNSSLKGDQLMEAVERQPWDVNV